MPLTISPSFPCERAWLEKLAKGRTTFVIAHRLSTIINADKIYVMKDGQVVEQGKYEELMKMDGYFALLAKRQSL